MPMWLNSRQLRRNESIVGRAAGYKSAGKSHADVAQLAEQLICNQQVIGSSPIIGFLKEQESLNKDHQLSWSEQPAHNRSVLGSSPRWSTQKKRIRPNGSVGQSAALSRRRSRVRVPLGSFWKFSSAGRASALQAEGHRFEPCNFHLHQFLVQKCRRGGTGRRAGLKILLQRYSTGSIPVAGIHRKGT